MGKTNRHERTESRKFKKLKGRNTSKRSGRGNSKAALNNLVSFQSERHIPNAKTLTAISELEQSAIEQAENGQCRTFDTVEEMLKDLHEPD